MTTEMKTFYIFINIFFILACSMLFLILMKDIWRKYDSKTTSTGTRFRNDGKLVKSMPCLTACTIQAYKTRGFFHTSEGYMLMTFNIEEIFANRTLLAIQNETLFAVKEVKSVFFGRCYTVCPLEDFKLNMVFELYFKKQYDLQLYLHLPGEEFWLMMFEFPTAVVSFQIKFKQETDMILADLSVQETETTLLKNENHVCENYDDFLKCCKLKFEEALRPKFSCTIPGITEVTNHPTRIECKTKISAAQSYTEFSNFLFEYGGNTSYLGCPLPCKQTSYKFKLSYYHTNTWINENEDFPAPGEDFLLSLFYSSLLVEERIETLAYDFPSFLAVVGGNLGLSLGFSCLSAALTFIKCIRYKRNNELAHFLNDIF